MSALVLVPLGRFFLYYEEGDATTKGVAPGKFSGALESDPAEGLEGMAGEVAAHVGGACNCLIFCGAPHAKGWLPDDVDRGAVSRALENVERAFPVPEGRAESARVLPLVERFVAMAGEFSRFGDDLDTKRYCDALGKGIKTLRETDHLAFAPLRALLANTRGHVGAVVAAGIEDAVADDTWAFNPGKHFVFLERYLEQLAAVEDAAALAEEAAGDEEAPEDDRAGGGGGAAAASSSPE